jgi:hypothetical protein
MANPVQVMIRWVINAAGVVVGHQPVNTGGPTIGVPTLATDASGNTTGLNNPAGGVFPMNSTGMLPASGDQQVISRDTSPFREGSNSVLTSGALYALAGDLVMKYWSHNVGLDANGNFLPRDDTGPCALMVFTEGVGTNAPIYKMYSCASGAAGTAPGTFNQVFAVDLTTGIMTLGNAQLLATNVALTNNAAAQAATLTNGPTAGNPTKWIPINDNGTIRNIPAW